MTEHKRWLVTRHTLQDVAKERTRQDIKWGVQDHDNPTWLAILGEEFGEAASAVLHNRFDNQGDVTVGSGNLRDELVQVAAVSIAWVEALDRKEKETISVPEPTYSADFLYKGVRYPLSPEDAKREYLKAQEEFGDLYA